MNDNEFRKAEKALREATRNIGGWEVNGTPEQKLEGTKLDCISMINSILAYTPLWNNVRRRTGEEILSAEEKHRKNYLEKYVEILGRDAVVKFIDEQINDISHINYGVFTDNEDVSYNSIVWKDKSEILDGQAAEG